MIIEIVRRTPAWVFVLFIALLVLGWSQSRTRSVTRIRLSLLPFAMLVLSFCGVLSSFGTVSLGMLCWALGVGVAALSGLRVPAMKGVSYSSACRSFTIPGSWVPLSLMMAIFFIKYGVGVILARRLPIAFTQEFVGLISYCYGFFSGLFLARSLAVWRVAKRTVSLAGPVTADTRENAHHTT